MTLDNKKRSNNKTDHFPDQKSPVRGSYNDWKEDWEEDEHGIYHGLTEEEAVNALIQDAKKLHIAVSNHDTHFDGRWGRILAENRNTDAKTKASSRDAKYGDAKTKAADKNEKSPRCFHDYRWLLQHILS